MDSDLKGLKIHFMGAGGIGMSALAQAALERGARVSGCDLVERGTLEPLRKAGARIMLGHRPAHVRDKDILVYTPAVPRNHPELTEAARRGVEILSREHFLARLMKSAFAIGITGAHGKTTTTWLTAGILLDAGYDPTVIVGGIVEEIGGNFHRGRGPYFVAEVDESNGIVEDFTAQVAVVTNVDDEHLDRFSGRREMAEAIRRFIARSGPGGKAVMWVEDPVLREIADEPPEGVEMLTVSRDQSSAFRLLAEGEKGVLAGPGGLKVALNLQLPGAHNRMNAALASVAALSVGVKPEAIERALAGIRPVKRRQNLVASARGVDVYDDYAHHPTEIEATYQALKPRIAGRAVAVFQPHRYSRTAALMNRFHEALRLFDEVVLLDIYSAGEEPIAGVNSAALVEGLIEAGCGAQYIPGRGLAAEYVAGIVEPGDAVLTLGAGDVGELAYEIARILAQEDQAG